MSTKCRCGRKKKRGRPFCRDCQESLPQDLRMGLYSCFGEGFEDAYDLAVRGLNG